MISKKCFIIAMVTLMSILTLTGCSTMLKNPMKYILSQDETRQDNSDKDNEWVSVRKDNYHGDMCNLQMITKMTVTVSLIYVCMEQKIIQIIPLMECWQ